MFARRAEVDVRAVVVVAFEPGKLVEHGRGRNIVEAGEHTSWAEDAEIVERGIDGGEQIGDGRLNPVHGGKTFRAKLLEAKGGGRGGGNWTPRPPLWAGVERRAASAAHLLESLNA